jgi:hypothetical protein
VEITMKIKSAVRTANDCIEHVLKEAYKELDYKYTGKPRRQVLENRIEHLQDVMETLKGMEAYIIGVHTISREE